MKFIYPLLLFILIFGFNQNTNAQNKDEQLAAQFFSNAEYDKAIDLYEKLLNKNPTSFYFYDNLLQSFIKLKQFGEAENLCKKMHRKLGSPYYLVDIGFIHSLNLKPEKAEKQYEEVIKKMLPNRDKIFETANAFEKRNELNFAIKTYLQGRKLLGYDAVFGIELANLYSKSKLIQPMSDEYLNDLEK